MKTYPAMNKKIANLLRRSDDPMCLYAAVRIDELEEGNEILHDAILDHQAKIGKLKAALDKACELIHGSLCCPITLLKTGEIDDFYRRNCGECDGNELALACWKRYFLEEADDDK